MHYFNHTDFNEDLKKDFTDANKQMKAYTAILHESTAGGVCQFDIDAKKTLFAKHLNNIKLKLILAFDALGLSQMSIELSKSLAPYNEDLAKLSCIKDIDVLFSPVLPILVEYHKALSYCLKPSDTNNEGSLNAFEVLEQILSNTAKILSDRKIIPTKEKEIQKAAYDILIHVFPDTIREQPVPQVSKTYKADFGIKSLKCLIELKFITNREEAKTAIGGIYEDIGGYDGSEFWDTFYAVFYMTEPFYTQSQIEAELKTSTITAKWKPIIIQGNGKRERKSKERVNNEHNKIS